MIFRKITLVPTFAEPAINFPISNRLLRDGLVDASMLVTHTFGFDDAVETITATGRQPADHQGGHAAERLTALQSIRSLCRLRRSNARCG